MAQVVAGWSAGSAAHAALTLSLLREGEGAIHSPVLYCSYWFDVATCRPPLLVLPLSKREAGSGAAVTDQRWLSGERGAADELDFSPEMFFHARDEFVGAR